MTHPTVLDRVTAADIRTDPYPHIVVDDALPAEVYARLRATLPDSDRIGWVGEKPSNIRLPFSAVRILADARMDAAWRAFAEAHASMAFVVRVLDLFADHWPAIDPPPAAIRAMDWGLLDDPETTDAMLKVDARIELNTAVHGRPSAVRAGHVDTPNRLFSGLFYCRAQDDPTPGGDLELYRWRGAPRDVARFQVGAEEIEAVATVPYAANRLVLFPNHAHALHGVTPRPPTPHERAYVFLTAEVAEDRF
jgi:hypothetical protein